MLPRRHSRGYTLVEVLVAFVILAMALSVLLRIFSGGVRNVGVSSDYAKAVLIAESRLATAGIEQRLPEGLGDRAHAFRIRRAADALDERFERKDVAEGHHPAGGVVAGHDEHVRHERQRQDGGVGDRRRSLERPL